MTITFEQIKRCKDSGCDIDILAATQWLMDSLELSCGIVPVFDYFERCNNEALRAKRSKYLIRAYDRNASMLYGEEPGTSIIKSSRLYSSFVEAQTALLDFLIEYYEHRSDISKQ